MTLQWAVKNALNIFTHLRSAMYTHRYAPYVLFRSVKSDLSCNQLKSRWQNNGKKKLTKSI